MTEKEKQNPASMCRFFMNWDSGGAGESLEEEGDGKFIENYEIIYNGISKYGDNEFGIEIDDEEVCGYPAPIIKFNLSKEVDPNDFCPGIRESSVCVQSIAQKESFEDGFIYEDWNGYSSVLEEGDAKAWIKELKKYGVYSGKVRKLQVEDGVVVAEENSLDTL